MRDEFERQAQRIQRIARRTFYQRGEIWEDAGYDPKKQTEAIRIKPFSDAYFALARRSQPFAQWAALGSVTLAIGASRALTLAVDGRETLTEKETEDLLAGLKN